MLLEFARDIGEGFSVEDYLRLSRIQGTLWTAADVVIVLYLLRIANLFRAYLGRRVHRVPYVLLAATLPPALYIPFVREPMTFFWLELAVTIPHFLLILYIGAANAGVALAAVSARSAASGEQGPDGAEDEYLGQ